MSGYCRQHAVSSTDDDDDDNDADDDDDSIRNLDFVMDSTVEGGRNWWMCIFGYVKGRRFRSSKTENRTLIVITMFPYRLRWYMNVGDDCSLNVAVYKSFEKLKNFDDGVSWRNVLRKDTIYDKFDIICMLGPLASRDEALCLVEHVHKKRGEHSRLKSSGKFAEREDLVFVYNKQRRDDYRRSRTLHREEKSMNKLARVGTKRRRRRRRS